MKLVAALVVYISLIPGTLSLVEPCKENLVYCGSTLEQYHGYTSDEIRSYISRSSLGQYIADAFDEPEDALFRCTDTAGDLHLTEFCYSGCTQPPNGDVCAAET
ncbi:hypothetical protein N7537_000588 [Penicillium hordei]|uniref:Uncharacterized protein n=1 Tax=Penicillium hordei TaxID=40994 RepID=A0AAD6EF45_9EURO|nr:uncharacterized protein N7537_000588 [Penicillium hordei]KAJ5615474.1 hypothetical protein N7537_000588 [Penicillium hordei]